MELNQIVEFVQRDLWGADGRPGSLQLFAPELTIVATIVLMLLVRVLDWTRWIDSAIQRHLGVSAALLFTIAGAAIALGYAAPWVQLDGVSGQRQELFTGMLVFDPLTSFLRAVLLVFVLLFALFTRISGIPDHEDAPDFYTLILGSTLGMMLMSSANHLLMVFLAVEMASVPSYALSGILKGRSESSEAALKYSIYGAGTAGVMLYGISLIAGVLNSAHLPTLAIQLAERWETLGSGETMILALGTVMLMVGLAFKLSAVPFHFWCPDVFEGASAEVNAFLSVASKAAAIALLVRVALGFGHIHGDQTVYEQPAPVASVAPENGAAAAEETPVALAESPPAALTPAALPAAAPTVAAIAPASVRAELNANLGGVCSFVAKLIAFLAAITCTFGNLAAYGQTNIKRLFAYSTIAHAGYMMMGVPPALELAARYPDRAEVALSALAIYIGVYLFMNLGAFAIVAFLRNALRSEEIADYAGLIRTAPTYAICMCIILFSLIGLPPFSGFVGKFAIFSAIVDAWDATSEPYLMVLLVIGGINTAVSLFYYLSVAKTMTIDPEPAQRPPVAFDSVWFEGLYVLAITVPTVGLGLSWQFLVEWARSAAGRLLS